MMIKGGVTNQKPNQSNKPSQRHDSSSWKSWFATQTRCAWPTYSSYSSSTVAHAHQNPNRKSNFPWNESPNRMSLLNFWRTNPNHQCAVPPSLKRAIADFATIMNGTTRRCMYVCMYNPKVVIPHAMVQCVITLGTTCHQDSIDRDILATNTRPFFFLDMSRQT